MFDIAETRIPGCFEILFHKLSDKRGGFIKTFHAHLSEKQGVHMNLREEYFTYSSRNVFRGLHFQTPPKALDKIVFCVQGHVTDYVVDLRVGSPAYGEVLSFDLNEDRPRAVFVPLGLAHGFYVRSAHAIMQYKVSETYDPAHDAGISWQGLPFQEEVRGAVISDRDQAFVQLHDFKSPFIFKP